MRHNFVLRVAKQSLLKHLHFFPLGYKTFHDISVSGKLSNELHISWFPGSSEYQWSQLSLINKVPFHSVSSWSSVGGTFIYWTPFGSLNLSYIWSCPKLKHYAIQWCAVEWKWVSWIEWCALIRVFNREVCFNQRVLNRAVPVYYVFRTSPTTQLTFIILFFVEHVRTPTLSVALESCQGDRVSTFESHGKLVNYCKQN